MSNRQRKREREGQTAVATPTSAQPEINGNGNGTHMPQPEPVPSDSPLTPSAQATNSTPPPVEPVPKPNQRHLALFCYEPPGSPIGQYLANLATAIAKRGTAVHLFACEAFEIPGVTSHAVGKSSDEDLVNAAQEFGQRAAEAFRKTFNGVPVTLLGHEWTSIPALVQLRLTEARETILLLHSLERQRSDLRSDLSRRIEEIEHAGLRDARAVLVHTPEVGDVARTWIPTCGPQIATLRQPLLPENFKETLDPGAVKARYQVGPIDPMILFIGDMDNRHAPDVIMKSMPAVLKNHPQARFVFVGEGDLLWPLRVHARYLLQEPFVRLLGNVQAPDIYDLIQSADVIVVPSREATEWWQVQVAWAAGRPVVVSHPLAEAMGLKHETDCVIVYPHESSCVWGIERVLFDEQLRTTLAANGKQQLEKRFGWGIIAEQIEELMTSPVSA